ncbi:WhiB family transcriptional regulator [Streptomyces sp. NPDC050804]|uniref:WhiB family transcriptional regulator n=1 Tax=Streptomyces sp. NPDC050804 TaxID=3154745 RepID=UPI003439B8FF
MGAMDWGTRAACAGTDAEALFGDPEHQIRAKAVCVTCPVRTDCLAHALDHRLEFGVWGGTTERERRSLLRRSPGVTSWRQRLDTTREARAAGSAGGRAQPGHGSLTHRPS